ncbi:hypothetical protein HYQ46_010994 [Verticillium longisporum]|nr:hypothetical protein HYQ46_010994 [Verticillium longisporum]
MSFRLATSWLGVEVYVAFACYYLRESRLDAEDRCVFEEHDARAQSLPHQLGRRLPAVSPSYHCRGTPALNSL